MTTKKPKPYHVMTVRLPLPDFEYLKKVRAKREKKDRRIVSYTEIMLSSVRELEADDVPHDPEGARREPHVPYHLMTFRFPISDFDNLKKIRTKVTRERGTVSYTRIILTGLREAS